MHILRFYFLYELFDFGYCLEFLARTVYRDWPRKARETIVVEQFIEGLGQIDLQRLS